MSLPRPCRVMAGWYGESTDAADIPAPLASSERAPRTWSPSSPDAWPAAQPPDVPTGADEAASEALRRSFINCVVCSWRGGAEDACCATR